MAAGFTEEWKRIVNAVGANTLWGLAALMLAGWLLRCWGLDFGLPNDSRPDEYNTIQVIVENLMTPMVVHGDFSLNPHFFRYPSLYFYLMLPFYFIFYWGLKGQAILSAYGQPDWQSFYIYWQDNPTPFHMILRWGSVVSGVLMIPAMFALAMQVLKNKPFRRETAWLAAILLTASYLPVRVSHFGGVDTPMTLLVMLALMAIVHFYRVRVSGANADKSMYIACLLIGMATGIKYPAAVLCVPLVVAVFKPYCDVKADRIHWPGFLGEAVKVVSLAFFAFLLTSPWVVLDVNQFWFDFRYEAVHYFGFMLPGLSSGWVFYPAFALFYGVGAWVLCLSLAGLWRAVKYENDYEHWILLSFLLAFYMLLGTNYRVLTRYALPLVPVLILYAAIAIRDAAQLLAAATGSVAPERLTNHRFPCVLVVVAVVVMYQPLTTALAFDGVLAQPDTRVLARNWLLLHLKQPQAVGVGPRLGQIKLPAQFGQLTIETGPNNMGGPPEKIEVTDSDMRTKNTNTYANTEMLHQLGIRYVVLYGGMPLFSNPPWEFEALSRQATPVARFTSLQPNVDYKKDMGQFDLLDAFYLPYDKFDAFERPGPEVTIFDLSQPPEENPADAAQSTS